MNIRCLSLISLVTVLGLVSVAQASPTAACQAGRGLKNVMLDMSDLSKKLQSQISDASKNADSANMAAALRDVTIEGLPLCVTKLEATSDVVAKRTGYIEYQRMMTQLFTLELDLEAALLKNDNATAVTIFTKIKDLQRAGHAAMRGSAETAPAVVEFHILKGTAGGVWNTKETIVKVKIGDTLRLVNDDTVDHRMHTNGAPCDHGDTFKPGTTYDCKIGKAFDATKSGPLYDHEYGSKAEFWVLAE